MDLRGSPVPTPVRRLGVALLVLWLSGCGGGGGGGAPTNPVPPPGSDPPPLANEGPRTVDQSVTLERGTIHLGTLSARDPVTRFRIVEAPAHGELHLLNEAEGTFRYIPDEFHVGLDRFGFRARNDEGESSTSHVSFKIARPQAMFAPDLQSGTLEGWEAFDDSGYDEAKHATISSNVNFVWTLSRGVIRQTVPFNKFGNVAPRLNGYAWGGHLGWPGGAQWEDYSLSVTLHPDAGGDELGVLFRYRGLHDHYRLSFSGRDSAARLERRTERGFVTLARSARGFQHADPFRVRVAVQSQTIRVFVEDEPIFAIVDEDPNAQAPRSGSIALYARGRAGFSELEVTPTHERPRVVLVHPQPYSVIADQTLHAQAVAHAAPEGSRIELSAWREDALITKDAQSPDALGRADLSIGSLAPGDQDLQALLLDVDGHVLARSGAAAVGINGRSVLTIGDSITNGTGDTYAFDNQSREGRVRGMRGIQAQGADWLSAADGTPHLLFNEAVPGDRIIHVRARLDSMLERHRQVDRALLLIGTNDAGAKREVAKFHRDLKDLVNDLVELGAIETHVALLPPAFGDSDSKPYPDPWGAPRNVLTREYNQVIDGSHPNPERRLNGHRLGPDLFKFFLGDPDANGVARVNRVGLYADNTHPNSLGHRLMAYLWYQTLNDDAAIAMPFFMDPLLPIGYRQNLRAPGDPLHLDNDYHQDTQGPRLLDHPDGWENAVWIMPRQADADSAAEHDIKFEVPRDAEVFVGYDARASIQPKWLHAFGPPAQGRIRTNQGDLNFDLNLWQRRVGPEELIKLGANAADGADGALHYVVVVVPDPDSSDKPHATSKPGAMSLD